jgi:hypothetical protein
MSDKNLVQDRINYLQKDIQYLITKKMNTELTNEQKSKIENDKKVKMTELKKLIVDLKQINKDERIKKQNQRDLNMVHKQIDNINYNIAKKKNDTEMMKSVQEAKDKREKAKTSFDEYKKKEEIYNESDSKQYPGHLFLHQSIILEYGLCPYINLEDQIEDKRKEWLHSQKDGGKIYENLYNEVISQCTLKELQEKHIKIQNDIDELINRNITEKRMEIYKTSEKFLEEYLACQIKTKRIKNGYKTLMHDLSVLKAETNLDIHAYMSLKYNHHITINDLGKNISKEQILINSMFNDFVKDYRDIIELIEQKQKYIANTIRNTKYDLYLYITNQKQYQKRQQKHITFVQEGKFFKRWGVLTEIERNDRFTSFAECYIENNKIDSTLNKPDLIEKLKNLLIHSYKTKQLIYRDFTWNKVSGYIENMSGIKYENDDFYLTMKRKEKNPNGTKKVSNRTMITKDNEKVINELILKFLLKDNEFKQKEECLELIKTKLKMKKISKNDKIFIIKKYDEIYNVINDNTLV